MCGIIGYFGKSPAQPVLLNGMKRMEYRGYDSSGLAVIDRNNIKVYKKGGKLQNLISLLKKQQCFNESVGIGHIRWATHGEPNDINAHPHLSSNAKACVVHNGIIENYQSLKERLLEKGYIFKSGTDTEVIANLIELYLQDNTLEIAVRLALEDVEGTYGIVVISRDEPEKIVAARLGSPLIIGIVKKGEYIVASDVTALLPYTRNVIYLEEHDMATITRRGHVITTIGNHTVERLLHHVTWDNSLAEKGGFDHFMLKEIMEQPEVVDNGLRGRLIASKSMAHLGGLLERQKEFQNIERIIMVGCGSASYATAIGALMIETLVRIPTTVEVGSEFRYLNSLINNRTAVMAVSQSGETADTIASLRDAKKRGALTFGIVNTVGSTIAREVDAGMYIHAGPEISVASTKGFTGMLSMFILFALALGRIRGIFEQSHQKIVDEFIKLPRMMDAVLNKSDEIKVIARKYHTLDNAYFLGRKYNYGIAREGAQKLKEISYVHAEGYHTGELKHGPLAVIDNRFYSVFIMPRDSVYEKNFSNLQELKARNGRAIVVTTKGNDDLENIADDIITIPRSMEMLAPLLTVIPLQLFAYHTAVMRRCEIDQPRNLAKSVTVE